MFVGSGSVNLKSAPDAFDGAVLRVPIRDHHSSGSLPHCLSSLPEQFRARSGTGTTPSLFQEWAEQGARAGPMHVISPPYPADHRPGTVRDRTGPQPDSTTGRRARQADVRSREGPFVSDTTDLMGVTADNSCRQPPRPPQVLPLAPPHGAAAPAPASRAWSWPSCSRSRPASASGAPRGCARAS